MYYIQNFFSEKCYHDHEVIKALKEAIMTLYKAYIGNHRR